MYGNRKCVVYSTDIETLIKAENILQLRVVMSTQMHTYTLPVAETDVTSHDVVVVDRQSRQLT